MAEHAGGCHCGAVRYEVAAEIDKVTACNCSLCSKRAFLLAFVPEGQFRLLRGADQLTDYQFGSKTIHHLFCRTCGIESFANGTAPDGTRMVAINARCVDDLDVGALTVTEIDGRSR